LSYKYETQHNAVSFTQGRNGKPIDKIVIHWWGDPATNPSYAGVINWFKNPSAGTSAHFVATGTNRSVAQLVDLRNTAWHAGDWNANLTSIGVELDPRCRPEDYDVAAELIADIRSAYGDLPLYWHSDFVATRCPGNWDVVKLDKLSYTKYSHLTDWGKGGNKVPTPPVVVPPKPPVVTPPKPPVVVPPKEPTPVPTPTPVPPVIKPEPPKENPKEDIIVAFTAKDQAVLQAQAQGVINSGNFAPVISDHIKTVAYFVTDSLAVLATLVLTVLGILGVMDAILALTLNGAIVAALIGFKQIFRISSKK